MPDWLQILGLAIKEGSPYLIKLANEQIRSGELDKTRAIQKEGFAKMHQVIVEDGYGRLQGLEDPEKEGSCPTCHIDSMLKVTGNHTWKLAHGVADSYPIEPVPLVRERVKNFLSSLIANFPCRECSDDAQSYLEKHPLDFTNRKTLQASICKLHDYVNKKLGKQTHGCRL